MVKENKQIKNKQLAEGLREETDPQAIRDKIGEYKKVGLETEAKRLIKKLEKQQEKIHSNGEVAKSSLSASDSNLGQKDLKELNNEIDEVNNKTNTVIKNATGKIEKKVNIESDNELVSNAMNEKIAKVTRTREILSEIEKLKQEKSNLDNPENKKTKKEVLTTIEFKDRPALEIHSGAKFSIGKNKYEVVGSIDKNGEKILQYKNLTGDSKAVIEISRKDFTKKFNTQTGPRAILFDMTKERQEELYKSDLNTTKTKSTNIEKVDKLATETLAAKKAVIEMYAKEKTTKTSPEIANVPVVPTINIEVKKDDAKVSPAESEVKKDVVKEEPSSYEKEITDLRAEFNKDKEKDFNKKYQKYQSLFNAIHTKYGNSTKDKEINAKFAPLFDREGKQTQTMSELDAKFAPIFDRKAEKVEKVDFDQKLKDLQAKLLSDIDQKADEAVGKIPETGEIKELIQEEKNTELKNETVANFVAQFKLEKIIPQEFSTLTEGQQLKVVQDLKKIMVNIVQLDSKNKYDEYMKEKFPNGFNRWLHKTFTKGYDMQDLEGKTFNELYSNDMGKASIAKNLEVFIKNAKDKELVISNLDTQPHIYYIKTEEIESWSPEEKAVLHKFNGKANEFQRIPASWEYSRDKNENSIYKRSKTEYEEMADEILRIRSQKEKTEEQGKAIHDMNMIKYMIKLEQVATENPQFEIIFDKLSKDPSKIEWANRALNKLVTQKGFFNAGLAGIGYGLRMGAKAAPIASSVTLVTGVAAPVIGAVLGGIRGHVRAKDTLVKNRQGSREGQVIKGNINVRIDKLNEQLNIAEQKADDKEIKKIKKEIKNLEKQDKTRQETGIMTDATHLAKRLDELTAEVKVLFSETEPVVSTNKQITPDKVRENKLALLIKRIEHTQGKIDKGEVNFGDAREVSVNLSNLTEKLTNALVLKEMMDPQNNKEITERINYLLESHSQTINTEKEIAEKKFIRREIRNAALIGAGAGLFGYGLRYVGEHTGAYQWIKDHAKWPWGEHLTPPPQEWLRGPNGEFIPIPPGGVLDIPIKMGDHVGNLLHETKVDFSSKGAIQTLVDLKLKLLKEYGDISKAPENIRGFLSGNATEQAKLLGLYDPTNTSGEESAMMFKGSTFRMDETGNLILHDVSTDQDMVLMRGDNDGQGGLDEIQKYTGKMFDADHSVLHENVPKPDDVNPNEIPQKVPEGIEPESPIEQKVPEGIQSESPIEQKVPAGIEPESPIEKTPDAPAPAQNNPSGNNTAPAPRQPFTGYTSQPITGYQSGQAFMTGPGQMPNMLPRELLPNFQNLYYELTPAEIQAYEKAYSLNIHKLFYDRNSMYWWTRIQDSHTASADVILNMEKRDIDDEGMKRLHKALKKLVKNTGLTPHTIVGGFPSNESSREFLSRVIQWGVKTQQFSKILL